VQLVTVTDDAEQAADAFLASVGKRQAVESLPSLDDLLAAPFVFIGTVAEIAEKLQAARERWGFTRYTVRAGAIDAVGQVMRALGGRVVRSST
jgi:hypothetical protein